MREGALLSGKTELSAALDEGEVCKLAWTPGAWVHLNLSGDLPAGIYSVDGNSMPAVVESLVMRSSLCPRFPFHSDQHQFIEFRRVCRNGSA